MNGVRPIPGDLTERRRSVLQCITRCVVLHRSQPRNYSRLRTLRVPLVVFGVVNTWQRVRQRWSLRWRRTLAQFITACSSILLLAVSSCLLSAPIHHSDTSFSDLLWDTTAVMAGNGGAVVGQQKTEPGNGKTYRSVSLSVNDGPAWVCAFHRYKDLAYTPSEQGPVAALSFRQRVTDISGWIDRGRFGPAVRQTGEIYVAGPCPWTRSGSDGWSNVSMLNLRAHDFAQVRGPEGFIDHTSHPDFSGTGDKLEFGFAWWGSSQDAPYFTAASVQEWAVTIDVPPVIPVADVKRQPDGEDVCVTGGVVSAVFGSAFYLSAPDRSKGIRVETQRHDLSPGTSVSIIGTLNTNADSERYIAAWELFPEAIGGMVNPLMMPNRALGGADQEYDPITGAGQRGVTGGVGLNNIGLLVRTWGIVQMVPGQGACIIDDGCGIGLLVVLPDGALQPSVGDALVVRGISSCIRTTMPEGQERLDRMLLATEVQ